MAVLGAAASSTYPQLPITQSMTWVPEMDGNVCIHLVGGGGGGAAGQSSYIYGGGGAGYVKIAKLAVTTSGSFTLVVGNGGNGGQFSTANGGISGAGFSGGDTTIAGTGISGTITAGGGGGGMMSWGVGGGGTTSVGSQSFTTVARTGGASGGSGGSGGAVGIHGTGTAGSNSYGVWGGRSDAVADGLGMSGWGYLVGGPAEATMWGNTGDSTMTTQGNSTGALSAGGGAYVNTTVGASFGGSGTLGGGGGGAYNAATNMAAYAYGGRGGDGIIVIQYLPW